MAECIECGKETLLKRAGSKFCSPKCREAHWHRAEREKRAGSVKYIFNCPVCGNEVRTNDQRKKYCSKECNWAAQNKKRPVTKFDKRICPTCNTEFVPAQKRGAGKTYCSSQCRSKAAYKRNVPRQNERMWDYRKRNKWGGNWWAALERDKFTCQVCGIQSYPSQWRGKSRKLVVHHLDGSGEKETKNHGLDNLMTVCDPCHRLFHGGIHLRFENGRFVVSGNIFQKLGIDTIETVPD